METIAEDLQTFLTEWHNPSPFLKVQTSGSTGTPKQITVRKEQMVNSARLTCDYLGLQQGDKALLCMPLQYIAGKMMVVRSLVAGLDLIVREPSGHPMAEIDTPLRFAAMIPLQVYNTLQIPTERERLCQTDILITNDVAELLPDGRFRILGRKDNIINSGGIKVQIESVEAALRPKLSANFAITAIPDPKFGEVIVLLVTDNNLIQVQKQIEVLPKYQRPKHLFSVDSIPLTGTGKIDRATCKRLAINAFESNSQYKTKI